MSSYGTLRVVESAEFDGIGDAPPSAASDPPAPDGSSQAADSSADAAGNVFLTPGQAAQLLGVCSRTVSRWGDGGQIPSVKTLGGHRRFRQADILALLQASAITQPRRDAS